MFKTLSFNRYTKTYSLSHGKGFKYAPRRFLPIGMALRTATKGQYALATHHSLAESFKLGSAKVKVVDTKFPLTRLVLANLKEML